MYSMINHLDLCSGIGGFALGFKWAKLSKTIAFCDFDKPCQKVLAKNFPNVPIFNDVKELWCVGCVWSFMLTLFDKVYQSHKMLWVWIGLPI